MENAKHTFRGLVLGILGTVLTAIVLWSFGGIRHAILQDNQVVVNTVRLDKVEVAIPQLQESITAVRTDHVALSGQVNQNHSDEMTAIRGLQTQMLQQSAQTTRMIMEALRKGNLMVDPPAAANPSKDKTTAEKR